MRNLCRIVKEEQENESQFCLKPFVDSDGYAQVCYLITYRDNAFDLLFFERNYDFRLFIKVGEGEFRVEVGVETYRFSESCFGEYEMVRYLPQEAQLLVLYSLFSRALELMRIGDDVIYYAADAAAAHAAAHAAAGASAYDAYGAAYDAVYAHIAADVYKNMKKAFKHLIEFRKRLEVLT